MSTTDRIEKSVVLRAPRARVWQALTDAREFGQWFGVRLEGEVAPGARMRGPVTHKGYEHLMMDMTIEQMEHERRFSWRWKPGATEPGVDYSQEPTTLVEFTLEDAPGGTRLTLVESGFDRVPAASRADAFRRNEQGWTAQMGNIERHVGQTS
jgi:uncharacterized protein YndB with AHSA1/START domain